MALFFGAYDAGDKLNFLFADRWFVFAALTILGLIAVVVATITSKRQ